MSRRAERGFPASAAAEQRARRDFDRELELAETAIHEGRTQSADTAFADIRARLAE